MSAPSRWTLISRFSLKSQRATSYGPVNPASAEICDENFHPLIRRIRLVWMSPSPEAAASIFSTIFEDETPLIDRISIPARESVVWGKSVDLGGRRNIE